MTEKIDVSVIIVNFNTSRLAMECIASVVEKTENVKAEIIVVDNNSSEDTSALRNCADIKYIQSETNLGFGRANNLGAEHARGEYLFFLNPDTYLVNNAIDILYRYISADDSIGICGGNLFTADMAPNHSYQLWFPGVWQELTETVLKILYMRKTDFNYGDREKSVAYITGADLMIKKELFMQTGGFDKDFFMYFEETFLCFMIKRAGYRIVNVPDARIVHLEGKSFELKTSREDLFYNSRKLYMMKTGKGRLYYGAYRIAFIINNLIKLFIFTATGNDKKNMILYRIKQMLNG